MTLRTRPTRRALHPRSFTLIEMLVVIGIILLLTAMTVTVIIGIQARTDARDVENTMALMDQALTEWELAMGRSITFGIDGEPCGADERYEIPQERQNGNPVGATPPWTGPTAEADAFEDAEHITDRIWALIRASQSATEILARIDPEYLEEEDVEMPDGSVRPTFHIKDAWGNEILAIHPGRKYRQPTLGPGGCAGDVPYNIGNGKTHDDDGSIRTAFEKRFGVAANRRIFFVSAGPDGLFGDLSAPPGSPEYQQTQDNIYSYEVIKP